MNQAVHQLLQLIQQGLIWFLRTIEMLWVWSWAQINSAFHIPWQHLPAWKIAIGILAIAVLAILVLMLLRRSLFALERIAAAFWRMAVMAFGIVAVVVVAGLFSRGVQWVVASVPDDFWQRLLSSS